MFFFLDISLGLRELGSIECFFLGYKSGLRDISKLPNPLGFHLFYLGELKMEPLVMLILI